MKLFELGMWKMPADHLFKAMEEYFHDEVEPTLQHNDPKLDTWFDHVVDPKVREAYDHAVEAYGKEETDRLMMSYADELAHDAGLRGQHIAEIQ